MKNKTLLKIILQDYQEICFLQKYRKLSENYPCHHFLSAELSLSTVHTCSYYDRRYVQIVQCIQSCSFYVRRHVQILYHNNNYMHTLMMVILSAAVRKG